MSGKSPHPVTNAKRRMHVMLHFGVAELFWTSSSKSQDMPAGQSQVPRALAIPELLLTILSFYTYDDRATLLSIALACHAFSDLALDALWFEINSISRLFRIFSNFKRRRHRGITVSPRISSLPKTQIPSCIIASNARGRNPPKRPAKVQKLRSSHPKAFL